MLSLLAARTSAGPRQADGAWPQQEARVWAGAHGTCVGTEPGKHGHAGGVGPASGRRGRGRREQGLLLTVDNINYKLLI
jgi:hypothetical protein